MRMVRTTALSVWLTVLLVAFTACGGTGATTPQGTPSGGAAETSAATDATSAATAAADTDAPTADATEATAPADTATAAPQTGGETLKVIATYTILGDFVQNIAGDNVELLTLVGPDGDPHVYEPTPSDAAAMAEADIIFENGLEFETWIDDLYTSSGSQAQRVVVTENITPIKAEEGGEHDEHGEHSEEAEHAEGTAEAGATAEADATAEAEEHAEAEGEHEHGEFDPHVWNDPNNAMAMVESIRDALVAADSANATTYESNAETYLAELKELDAFIIAETEKLPEDRRKLVTSHDTFGYFAEQYGYEVVGTALGSVTTEAADPSGGEIAELVEAIRAAGVPAIFAENSSNPDLMERIASEANVTLAPSLYPEALSEAGGEADTYIKMVRYNVTTIVTALGQ